MAFVIYWQQHVLRFNLQLFVIRLECTLLVFPALRNIHPSKSSLFTFMNWFSRMRYKWRRMRNCVKKSKKINRALVELEDRLKKKRADIMWKIKHFMNASCFFFKLDVTDITSPIFLRSRNPYSQFPMGKKTSVFRDHLPHRSCT